MLTLPSTLRLTPLQFAEVCAANPEAVLELAADGQLIEMTPTGGGTSARNLTLGALLWLAVRRSGLPLKVFDSSGGFLLPDGSVRSSDASLGWLLLTDSRSVQVWRATDTEAQPFSTPTPAAQAALARAASRVAMGSCRRRASSR